MLTPVEFVPVHKVFKPMVEVVFLKDVSGWVNGDKTTRKKWAFSAGKTYAIDKDKAREYVAKDFATPVHPLNPPLEHDEILEFRSQVTTISMGGI